MDIKEALNAAFDKQAAGSGDGGPDISQGSQAPESTAAEHAEPVGGTVAPVDADASSSTAADHASEAEDSTPPVATGRARDASGKFIKAEATASLAPKGSKKPTPTPTPVTTNGTTSTTQLPGAATPTPTPEPTKAPQSWSPLAREAFAKAPPEVQKEALKREREITQTLSETAEARRFHDAFRQTVSPYEGMIRAEGGDPIRAVGSLLQTAAALRTAPPAHKAQLVANIVKQFNIPIEALDQALAGQAPQAAQHGQEFRDPRFDQFLAEMNQAQAQRAQAQRQTLAKEAESFAANAEFFEDVRHDIADILDVAARRGRALSLEEAYNRAVALHPELSKVMEQRKAAEAATARNAATQRALIASTPVKSQPAGAAAPQPKGIREQLAEAASKFGG